MTSSQLTLPRVLRFYLPLAGTWLMMSVEGPLLTAVIARMTQPVYNLAAFGVAFSVALIIEAPVIMMLSAATALVRDCDSYRRLRDFTNVLNGLVTAALALVLLPAPFQLVTESLLGLDPEVAARTHLALLLLLPWPGTIGYRRFYQGIMIRHGQTRRVAYGTVIRLTAMVGTMVAAAELTSLPGAAVAAAALSAGVTTEALASRVMARSAVKQVLAVSPAADAESLIPRIILRFYIPLALTSLIGLAVHPMVTFFMGHSREALSSLAVLPVVNSLVFIFRSLGLAAQEVFIALMGDRFEGEAVLRRFALILGITATACLSVIAWTPLATLWFEGVSGLTPDLARFALAPVRILALIPGLTVLLSWQRAMLVNHKNTAPVTVATAMEITVATAVLSVGVLALDWVGATVAAAALLLGRLSANAFLARRSARAG